MEHIWILVATCVIFGGIPESEAVDLTIPRNLSIGTATSATQTEGAWNVSGKGISVWDEFTHNSSYYTSEANGDIACNSYYKYKEDVAHVKSMGLKFYRFSISWPRVLPTGFTNVINEEGLRYYKNLTEELIANGIEPMVTLLHLDHPQILEEFGGWTNELMVDWFVDYARIIFEALGDRVKVWTTINQPNYVCAFTYEKNFGKGAPGKELNGTGVYHCMHNILKAHASVYHMYDKEFRPTQKGSVGISAACFNYIAADPDDTTSPDTAFDFLCGWVYHPLFIGDYPEVMKTRIANLSAAQGYPRSRLPEFSDEWVSYIKGTSDYIGINFYASWLVYPNPDVKLETGFTADPTDGTGAEDGILRTTDPSWPKTAISFYTVTPSGLRDILGTLKNKYGNPPVRIMECGYSDTGDELDDYNRISFHYQYLEQLLIAVKEDGCNVESYSVWSLLDDFELFGGYVTKFGLVSVDFNDTERTRSNKLSADWFKDVMTTGQLQPVPTNCTV